MSLFYFAVDFSAIGRGDINKQIETKAEWISSSDAWCRHMQTSTDYLGIAKMQAGMAYAIWARNAYVGIWLPDEQGFLLTRYKLAQAPVLFVEYHWDTGEPFGTAKPLRLLEKCPFPALPDISYLDQIQNAALCVWLDDLETRHPPVPGWDSVGERRQSMAAWKHRQDRQRAK